MCSGEQDALVGELVEPWARDVGMTIDPQIAPCVVPVHEHNVVTVLVCYVAIADCRHLLSLLATSTLSAPVHDYGEARRAKAFRS